jgi:hypothetical protein
MESRSKHYIDTSRWICKVIQSCETVAQANKCRKLIYNWNLMHAYKPSVIQLVREMRAALDFKLTELLQNSKQIH